MFLFNDCRRLFQNSECKRSLCEMLCEKGLNYCSQNYKFDMDDIYSNSNSQKPLVENPFGFHEQVKKALYKILDLHTFRIEIQ